MDERGRFEAQLADDLWKRARESAAPSSLELFAGVGILALTTVRLSTDKIFGWQPTKASTPLEITVLAIYGWIHWLLLSVASALIVARALRPARSGIFSPDSVVNDDSLQVRRCVLVRRRRRENSSECVRSTARRSTRQRAGSFHGAAQLEPE